MVLWNCVAVPIHARLVIAVIVFGLGAGKLRGLLPAPARAGGLVKLPAGSRSCYYRCGLGWITASFRSPSHFLSTSTSPDSFLRTISVKFRYVLSR